MSKKQLKRGNYVGAVIQTMRLVVTALKIFCPEIRAVQF